MATEATADKGRRKTDPALDQSIGNKIRLRRNVLNMSQEQLGEAVGVSFQQVQKYERGTNRVAASMLVRIAGILGVPVAYFLPKHDANGKKVADDLSRLITSRDDVRMLENMKRIGGTRRTTMLAMIEAWARCKNGEVSP